MVILASVLAFFLMASGNTMLEKENEQLNQWVPTNHHYRENNDWLQMNKPESKVRGKIRRIFGIRFGYTDIPHMKMYWVSRQDVT